MLQRAPGCDACSRSSSRARSPCRAAAADFTPGAAGVGDPFFPKAGNGGYDVAHYDLDLATSPAHAAADARRAITAATATQDLSRFDLDYRGPRIVSVSVGRRPGAVQPRRPGAGDHARRRNRSGVAVHVAVSYRGEAAQHHRPRRLGRRLDPHRRRRVRRSASRRARRPGFRATTRRPTRRPTGSAITVPKRLKAISNGRLVEPRPRTGPPGPG